MILIFPSISSKYHFLLTHNKIPSVAFPDLEDIFSCGNTLFKSFKVFPLSDNDWNYWQHVKKYLGYRIPSEDKMKFDKNKTLR